MLRTTKDAEMKKKNINKLDRASSNSQFNKMLITDFQLGICNTSVFLGNRLHGGDTRTS